jgi:hypothetical protein
MNFKRVQVVLKLRILLRLLLILCKFAQITTSLLLNPSFDKFKFVVFFGNRFQFLLITQLAPCLKEGAERVSSLRVVSVAVLCQNLGALISFEVFA